MIIDREVKISVYGKICYDQINRNENYIKNDLLRLILN